jgi:hypothetical protein
MNKHVIVPADNDEDQWSAEEFEDQVARSLIAFFETRVKRRKNLAPEDRLGTEHLVRMRNRGLYIPSPSRVIVGNGDDNQELGQWQFDVINDKLPVKGCFAFAMDPKTTNDYDGYLHVVMFDQRSALGKGWHKRSNGQIYEYVVLSPGKDVVDGERRFFTVDKAGNIHAADKVFSGRLAGGGHGVVSLSECEPHILNETEAWGMAALHFTADRRFCWTIAAQESPQGSAVHLGCMREEIKSLLYARTLPMSATGRKRPILHLVEAHKRRLRSGTDVDIDTFLRGVPTVEIGGTLFTVRPPAIMKTTVSKNSQKFFETQT